MTRISNAFEQASGPLLNVYFTAGYPKLESTRPILKALEAAGADMVELGMPYSDPLADGETIQNSSSVALKNGMSIEKLFEQLEGIREEISLPILLMGYLNPIMQFGAEKFCKQCAQLGIDGLIIPDLPMELFDLEFKFLLEESQLDFVFLITPETPPKRIMEIDRRSSGFIYMVSSSSTTGKTGELTENQLSYFRRVEEMKLKNKRLIGFGISDNKSFAQASEFADGAIVGSAFIKYLATDDSDQGIKNFVKTIKG